MTRSLAILAVLLGTIAGVGGTADRAPATLPAGEVSYVVRGVVERIDFLSKFKGNARAVDIDPRFVVVVRDVTIVQGKLDAGEEKKVAFAIHSPANTFGTGEVEGKRFEFTVTEYKRGKATMRLLQVKEVVAPQAK